MIELRLGDDEYPHCSFCVERGNKTFELFSGHENRNQIVAICEKCLRRQAVILDKGVWE